MKSSLPTFKMIIEIVLLSIGLATACVSPKTSRVKVIGGSAATNAELPVQTVTAVDQAGRVIISGSGFFVSDQLLLTVAHVVAPFLVGQDVHNYVVYDSDQTQQAFRAQTSDVLLPDIWQDSKKAGDYIMQNHNWAADIDIAVLRFPPGTARPDQIVSFFEQAPALDQDVVVKGVGISVEIPPIIAATLLQIKLLRDILFAVASGHLRQGPNTIFAINKDNGLIYLARPAGDKMSVSSGNGDSGSALFDRETSKVLGLVAFGHVMSRYIPSAETNRTVPDGTPISGFISPFNANIYRFLVASGVVMPKNPLGIDGVAHGSDAAESDPDDHSPDVAQDQAARHGR